ncbi:MAG: HNH endonuclease signature motif containing protein [Parvibaculaceae bacterium]
MPYAAPRHCACGRIVPARERCACQKARDLVRKARHDAKRPSARQRGYTSEWQKARADYLKAHPYCVMCDIPANTVDHIEPHKGDERLFWDRTNWQSLCASCHSRRKQRQERREVRS